jgi:3-deoxy-D-manno-octulosonic-acid transferase
MSFIYALYTVLTATLFLFAIPIFLWRGRGTGKYLRNFRERMGLVAPSFPRATSESIWVHAVSVGEALAARPLVEKLKERFPSVPLYVSTTTLTGRAVAERSLRADGFFYAPFDWPRPVRRALEHVNPKLLVLVETEIWPNLIVRAKRRGARVALVNGRISSRALPRYLAIRALMARLLALIDLFLMQSDTHAGRIRRMGAPDGRVFVTGNLKFDARLPVSAARVLALLGRRRGPVFVAGSTMEGEEEAVLAAFRALRGRCPEACLILVPRHPERFARVFDVVQAAGFRCQKRSELQAAWADGEVLLLDTLGELAHVYAVASVVFVGGSLVPTGGHNVLEAAIHGRAVIVGPHMQNFQEIADLFLGAGALVQVASPADLPDAIVALATDEARRERIGEAARGLLEQHRGAVDRTVDALSRLLA